MPFRPLVLTSPGSIGESYEDYPDSILEDKSERLGKMPLTFPFLRMCLAIEKDGYEFPEPDIDLVSHSRVDKIGKKIFWALSPYSIIDEIAYLGRPC
jgi:hypothetical protein